MFFLLHRYVPFDSNLGWQAVKQYHILYTVSLLQLVGDVTNPDSSLGDVTGSSV